VAPVPFWKQRLEEKAFCVFEPRSPVLPVRSQTLTRLTLQTAVPACTTWWLALLLHIRKTLSTFSPDTSDLA
jgi:hypothetical protein